MNALAKQYLTRVSVELMESLVDDEDLNSTEVLTLVVLVYLTLMGTGALWAGTSDKMADITGLLVAGGGAE